MEEKNKSNVVVLTVIAIATMIVVVIGATFAYLANSVQTGDTAEIQATTEGTSDLLLIEAGSAVEMTANFDNFGEDMGDMSRTIYSSVVLQTKNASAKTYYYDVYLEVPTNDFDYTSGACYTVGTKSNEGSYEACQASGKLWAKTSGNATYSCYNTSELVNHDFYSNNAASCLTEPTYMWAQNDIAEIAIDIYKGVDQDVVSCPSYKNGGVCVDAKRNILGSITAKADCVGDNRWLANSYEENVCYVPEKSFDITKVKTDADMGESFPIFVDESSTGGVNAGESITAPSGSSAANNYKTVITLINLKHNQIDNGNKTFKGLLNFKVTGDYTAPGA